MLIIIMYISVQYIHASQENSAIFFIFIKYFYWINKCDRNDGDGNDNWALRHPIK